MVLRGKVALAGCVVLLWFAASADAEVATHEFDPILSLTGGCGTSSVDPAPDPGCPLEHAPREFSKPLGVTTDASGDVYVANGGTDPEGKEGRIDVFDPAGHFLLELASPGFPRSLAVDSQCQLYVQRQAATPTVVKYVPSACPPASTTTYSAPQAVDPGIHGKGGIAVDPLNDHLFVLQDGKAIGLGQVVEYSSTGEVLATGIGEGELFNYSSATIAVDGASGDIYVSTTKTEEGGAPSPKEPFVSVVKVFGPEAGHPLKYTVDGSATAAGGFLAPFARLGVAADESTGDLYVSDVEGSGDVYQFRLDEEAAEYEFVSTIEHSFQGVTPVIAFDTSSTSPNQGYLFVPSHPSGLGHLFAFGPIPEEAPPLVSGESFSGLSSSEVTLEAEVDPGGLPTGYRFEYVDDATFELDVIEAGPGHGFDHAVDVPVLDAQLAPGSAPVAVSEAVSGLLPETKYHFRLRAENAQGVAEGERAGASEVERVFATYPPSSPGLPDGRAYELATPPDTNGRLPTATGIGIGDGFETDLVAPAGSGGGTNLLYETIGGSLPGSEGTGSINGDVYEAERGASGWSTTTVEPSGAESQAPSAGGYAADHGYSFWNTAGGGVEDQGSLVIEGEETHYLRAPDGSFRLLGVGSTGEEDPQARGVWISAGGGHAIFTSPYHLEPGAPPTPSTIPGPEFGTIYDRAPSGATQVVSLLPEDAIPASAGEIAYRGASADGSSVAFAVGSTLYERRGGTTFTVAEGNPTFAGISRDGGRVFYVQSGNVFAFDAGEGTALPVGSGGESTVVNVSADGSHAYFVSRKRLEGQGKSGKDNLYAWSGGGAHLIGVLEHVDVTGKEEGVLGFFVDGLGLWTTYAVGRVGTNGGPANDPSRSTPDGRFLVFQSRADLTGYDPEGQPEVYRYDDAGQSLLCVSCNPTLAPVVSGGRLESLSASGDQFAPGNSLAPTANVTEDGGTVFFESRDALVPGDVDGAQDVYEWQAQGTGGCARPAGCLSLISGGHSAGTDYLYAASRDGRDVFFRTGDRLLDSDKDATPSIYDARVGGGFPEGERPACEGDACRGAPSQPPSLPEIASSGSGEEAAPKRHCGKHLRLSRGGRCLRKHPRHRHHRHKHGPGRQR